MALYEGAGGAVFEMEPPEGGNPLEQFEAKLASGELTLIDATAPKATAKPAPKPDDD